MTVFCLLLLYHVPNMARCLSAFICVGICNKQISVHRLFYICQTKLVTLLFEEFVPSQFCQDVYNSNHSVVLGQVQPIDLLLWLVWTQVGCFVQSHQFPCSTDKHFRKNSTGNLRVKSEFADLNRVRGEGE